MIFLAVISFLISFYPFLAENHHVIIDHVFKYGGLAGLYGISFILNTSCSTCRVDNLLLVDIYKYIFIFLSLIFIFFLQKRDIIRSLLLSILFFLSFTSGIGAQYFILPIALGSIYPKKGFYLYTFITSLFLFGNSDELNFPLFQIISWNIVWIFTFWWFLEEISQEKDIQKILKKIHFKMNQVLLLVYGK